MTYARDQLAKAREGVATTSHALAMAKENGSESILPQIASDLAYWTDKEACFAPIVEEEDLDLARRAVFTPAPIDQLGIALKPTSVNANGEWTFEHVELFRDAKGALADRRIETMEL